MKVARTVAAISVAVVPLILLGGCVLRELPRYW